MEGPREAAAADVDNISLRDLRSVVTGSDVARDEETRALATTLREALEARVTRMHDEWAGEITTLLDEGRVVRAVRLSSRPPEPSARLPVELAGRLAEAAGQAMNPESSSDLWASLLDAVAASPIRRSVVPAGLPENASPDLRKATHQQSGNIPALAKLLGVSIPPPPPVGSSRRQARCRVTHLAARDSPASLDRGRRTGASLRRGGSAARSPRRACTISCAWSAGPERARNHIRSTGVAGSRSALEARGVAGSRVSPEPAVSPGSTGVARSRQSHPEPETALLPPPVSPSEEPHELEPDPPSGQAGAGRR